MIAAVPPGDRRPSSRLRRGVPRLLSAALLLLSGCEDRQRSNPFDPENPETAGRPRLLNAIAGDGVVRLEWDLSPWPRIEEMRIRRRLEPSPESEIYRMAPGGSGSFLDPIVDNGIEAIYRLEVRAPNGEWLPTVPDTATTGASVPWLGDAAGYGLVRLAPDGRDALFRTGDQAEVLDLEPQEDGSVWGADFGNGEVVRYGPDGFLLDGWDCYGANTLALDRRQDLLWVGAFLQQRVYLYDRQGAAVWVDSTSGPVEHLRAALEGGVWCCARGGHVRRLEHGRVALDLADFVQPVAVAVDSTGRAWIADRGAATVERVEPSGLIRETSSASFTTPVEIELGPWGGAWVADPGRGVVVFLDERLKEKGFVSVPDAGALNWDALRGDLWVCRPAAGRVEVFRVTGTGPGGWSAQRRVSVDVGGRPNVLRAFWRP